MANYYEQIRIKTATEGTHKRTMKADTDTSTDFGQFLPLRAKLLEIGDGTITPYTFSNMMPLPQPTFGECVYENRFYIVPIHQIFSGYEDFRQDNIHVTADESSLSLTILPYTKNSDIVMSIATMSDEVTQQADYDFAIDHNGTIKYYKYTEKSRWWVKCLMTLGYRWIYRTGYQEDGKNKNVLKILAMAKVYIDYFYNRAYKGDTEEIEIRQMFKRDNGNIYYDWNDLVKIANVCNKVFYNKDYFTAAWDRPDTPNITNQKSNYAFRDPNGPFETSTSSPTNADTIITNNSNRIPGEDPAIMGQRTAGNNYPIGGITQVGLNMLKSLTMFLKRNQLAGGDTLQRFLARYGIINDDLKSHYSRLIGTVKWGLNVSPIFSNADTAQQGGEVLGSYAGNAYAESVRQGQERQQFKVDINCDAILMDILVVTPVEKYVDGEDMENLVLTKTELITPEFDNVGTTPVIAAELVMPRRQGVTTDNFNIYEKIFGWLPRYAYIKTMKDIMTGNYADMRYRNIYLPYTMVRVIDDNQPINGIVHSKDFTRMSDNLQYDRIFYGQPSDKAPFDNINIHHELEIEWWSYAKPLYDNYDWEHEGGKVIDIQNQ